MSILLEDTLPDIRENGLNTNENVVFGGNLTVSGTTTIAGVTLTDLTVSGNTIIGNGASDTLAVTGLSTFTAAATTGAMVGLTNTGIYTGTGLISLTATAATTGTLILVTSAGLTTGTGLKFTLAGLTTGSAIDTTGIAATKQNINMNASTGSTAAPQTNAPTGFFKIGIGGTDQWVPYYNAT